MLSLLMAKKGLGRGKLVHLKYFAIFSLKSNSCKLMTYRVIKHHLNL